MALQAILFFILKGKLRKDYFQEAGIFGYFVIQGKVVFRKN